MSAVETIGKYVVGHYGNLVLYEEPVFDEERRLWISRLHSDYPVIIQNDFTKRRELRFIKISPLGFVAFDQKMRLNRSWTSSRDTVASRIRTYLDMWRAYAENIMISASADRIVDLPEVATALNPIYEILLILHEEGQIHPDDLVSERGRRKEEDKNKQYIALLEGLDLLRHYDGKYVRGNAFVSLEERNAEFNHLVKTAFSMILSQRYPYLREVIALTNLERLIKVGNTVYYPELHAHEAVPRDSATLVKEYTLEYGGEIPRTAIRSNLYKLKGVKIVEQHDSMYQGTNSLRNTMLNLLNMTPSPDTVWSVPTPS